MDSETVLHAIEANLVSSIRRVSGDLSILQHIVVCHLHDLGKIFEDAALYLLYNQNIAKLLNHPSIIIDKKKKRIMEN